MKWANLSKNFKSKYPTHILFYHFFSYVLLENKLKEEVTLNEELDEELEN